MVEKFKVLLQKNRLLLWLVILAVAILWGYAWVVMKLSLQYMGPFTFSAFRFATGTITMFVILHFTEGITLPWQHMKDFMIIGILQTAVVFLLVMYGLLFVDAGKSSMLLYSMPIWTSILAVTLLGERLTYGRVMGLSVGFVGLLTILGWDLWFEQSKSVIFGEMLIMIAFISWALSNVYYRRYLKDVSLLQVSTWQMLFGTMAIIIVSIIMEFGEPMIINMKSIYYILFMGVFASALCFTVWFLILSIIDMITATISSMLVPVFGLFLSYIIIGERLTGSVLIGSGLIVVGVVVAHLSKVEKESKEKSAS